MKKLKFILTVIFGLATFNCLLERGTATIADNIVTTGNAEPLHFHLSDLVAIVSFIVLIFITIVGSLLKRSVFKEIDDLKETKQEKTMCEQIESVACRDREEIKADLKTGVRKFNMIDRKIDRIMVKMKLPIEEEKDDAGNL